MIPVAHPDLHRLSRASRCARWAAVRSGAAALLVLCSMAHAQVCGETKRDPAGAVPQDRALYIVIGQSNAAGLASVKDLVPPGRDYVSPDIRYPNVQIYGIRGAEAGVAGNDDAARSTGVAWSTFARWYVVQPGFGFKNVKGNEEFFPRGSTALDLFGPEVHLSAYLNEELPKEHFIVKLAISNTTLAAVPGADSWTPGGHLYQELLKMVAHAYQEKAGKIRLRVGAVFLVQGESDATNPKWAAAYERNISHFIQRLRADLFQMGCSNFKNIPFVMSRVQDNVAWPFREPVRRAQEKASRTQIRVTLIDTDDLNEHFTAGSSHFNEYAQVKLGERFYLALRPRSAQFALPPEQRRRH